MADNLTVKGDIGNVGVAPTSEKDPQVDTDKADLDRLRQIAKKNTGKNLSDDALRAIRTRRRTKMAEQQRLGDTKKEFQADQGKEKVATQSAEKQNQAQKTAGTEKSTRAGELGDKEAKNVRSNPRSGPNLPPTLAKPTTEQQATKLLDKIFTFVEIDGESLDRKAYASNLKEMPATKPKEQQQTAQNSAKITAGRGPTSNQPGAGGRTTGQPTVKLPTGKTAQPMGKEATGPSLGRPTSNTSFRMGGPGPLARSTTVSPDGLYNAGGGLITNSSFDGANFNWDAFQWFFTMMVMQDLHKYRKLMKELRRLQGKSALFGKKLREAIEDMRQTFERNNATAKFFESVQSAVGGIQQSISELKLEEAMGEKQGEIDAKKQEVAGKNKELGNNEKTLQKDKAKLAELKEKGGTADEIAKLERTVKDGEDKSAQLSDEIAAGKGKIEELKMELEDLRREGKGKGGKLEEIAGELLGINGKEASKEQLEQFKKNLADYESTIEGLMAQKSAAPMIEQRGRDLSAQLRSSMDEVVQRNSERKELDSQLKGLEKDVLGNAEKIKELEGQLKKLDAKDEAHEILAMKVVIHESVMASITRPKHRGRAYDAAEKAKSNSVAKQTELENKAKVLEGSDTPADLEKKADLENQVFQETATQKDLADLLLPGRMLDVLKQKGEGDLDAWKLIEGLRTGDKTISTDDVDQMRKAGQFLRTNREGQLMAKITRLAEKGSNLLNKMAEATEGAKDAAEQAVDTVIDHSTQITLEGKQEANRALRQTSSRTQGMINQLMQISRMARSSS
ncbi:MAG: hypothetical protein A2289_03940 [Deltaproteobacteria bacterium RIFOXYA12_FULL_58_15]|nr:MAG: hypothetical protein A2289_03940 [Deltaproteobacteria bacterium RIFOXYA12_FULL_58_15]